MLSELIDRVRMVERVLSGPVASTLRRLVPEEPHRQEELANPWEEVARYSRDSAGS
jgi:hypothetical protein